MKQTSHNTSLPITQNNILGWHESENREQYTDQYNGRESNRSAQQNNYGAENQGGEDYKHWEDAYNGIPSDDALREEQQVQYNASQPGCSYSNQQWALSQQPVKASGYSNQQINPLYSYEPSATQNYPQLDQYNFKEANPYQYAVPNYYNNEQGDPYDYCQGNAYNEGQPNPYNAVDYNLAAAGQDGYKYGDQGGYTSGQNAYNYETQIPYYQEQNMPYTQVAQNYYNYAQPDANAWQATPQYYDPSQNQGEYYPAYQNQEFQYNIGDPQGGIRETQGKEYGWPPEANNTYVKNEALSPSALQEACTPQETSNYNIEANNSNHQKLKSATGGLSLSDFSSSQMQKKVKNSNKLKTAITDDKSRIRPYDYYNLRNKVKSYGKTIPLEDLKSDKTTSCSSKDSDKNIQTKKSREKKFNTDDDGKPNEIYIEAKIPRRKKKKKMLEAEGRCPLHYRNYKYHARNQCTKCCHRNVSCMHQNTQGAMFHCPCLCKQNVGTIPQCTCAKKCTDTLSVNADPNLSNQVSFMIPCCNHQQSTSQCNHGNVLKNYHILECHAHEDQSNQAKCSAQSHSTSSPVCCHYLNPLDPGADVAHHGTDVPISNQCYKVLPLNEKSYSVGKLNDSDSCYVVVSNENDRLSNRPRSLFPCFFRRKKLTELTSSGYPVQGPSTKFVTVKIPHLGEATKQPLYPQKFSNPSSRSVYLVKSKNNSYSPQNVHYACNVLGKRSVSACPYSHKSECADQPKYQTVHCIGHPPSMTPNTYYVEQHEGSPRNAVVHVVRKSCNSTCCDQPPCGVGVGVN